MGSSSSSSAAKAALDETHTLLTETPFKAYFTEAEMRELAKCFVMKKYHANQVLKDPPPLSLLSTGTLSLHLLHIPSTLIAPPSGPQPGRSERSFIKRSFDRSGHSGAGERGGAAGGGAVRARSPSPDPEKKARNSRSERSVKQMIFGGGRSTSPSSIVSGGGNGSRSSSGGGNGNGNGNGSEDLDVTPESPKRITGGTSSPVWKNRVVVPKPFEITYSQGSIVPMGSLFESGVMIQPKAEKVRKLNASRSVKEGKGGKGGKGASASSKEGAYGDGSFNASEPNTPAAADRSMSGRIQRQASLGRVSKVALNAVALNARGHLNVGGGSPRGNSDEEGGGNSPNTSGGSKSSQHTEKKSPQPMIGRQVSGGAAKRGLFGKMRRGSETGQGSSNNLLGLGGGGGGGGSGGGSGSAGGGRRERENSDGDGGSSGSGNASLSGSVVAGGRHRMSLGNLIKGGGGSNTVHKEISSQDSMLSGRDSGVSVVTSKREGSANFLSGVAGMKVRAECRLVSKTESTVHVLDKSRRKKFNKKYPQSRRILDIVAGGDVSDVLIRQKWMDPWVKELEVSTSTSTSTGKNGSGQSEGNVGGNVSKLAENRGSFRSNKRDRLGGSQSPEKSSEQSAIDEIGPEERAALFEKAMSSPEYCDEVGILLSFARFVGFRDGQPLFFEGDPGDSLYILLDGECCVTNDVLQNAAAEARRLAEEMEKRMVEEGIKIPKKESKNKNSSQRNVSVQLAKERARAATKQKVVPIGGEGIEEGGVGGDAALGDGSGSGSGASDSPETASPPGSNSPSTPQMRKRGSVGQGVVVKTDSPAANVNYRRNSLAKESGKGSNLQLTDPALSQTANKNRSMTILGTFKDMLSGKDNQANLWEKIVLTPGEVLYRGQVGDCFGELSVLSSMPRTTSVIATKPSLFLAINKEDWAKFIYKRRHRRKIVHRHLQTNMMERLANMNISFFESVDQKKYAELAGSVEVMDCPPHQVIMKQGDRGDKFYVIMHGKCLVEVKARTDSPNNDLTDVGKDWKGELGRGKYFGEIALVMDSPRKATVTTIEQTMLLAIDAKTFKLFFQGNPNALAEVQIRMLGEKADLLSVLMIPRARVLFRNFLETEHAEENMVFWEAVDSFEGKYKPGDQSMEVVLEQDSTKTLPQYEEAKNIWDSYLKVGAELQVNISSKMRQNIQKMISMCGKWTDGIDVVNDGTTTRKMLETSCEYLRSRTVFNEAKQEIYRLMVRDSYPRFKKSDPFIVFIKEIGLYSETNVNTAELLKLKNKNDTFGDKRKMVTSGLMDNVKGGMRQMASRAASSKGVLMGQKSYRISKPLNSTDE